MKTKFIIILLIVFIAGIMLGRISTITLGQARRFYAKSMQKVEKEIVVNLPKAKTSLVISDFENKMDLKKWEFSNSKGELSREHVTSGAFSLKIYFKPAEGASSMRIEDYIGKNKDLADWSHYGKLSFDIFNPGNSTERLILNIKDSKKNKKKTEIYLEPEKFNHIELELEELGNEINVNRIGQLNLFLWNNANEKIFYLDNVKLLPKAAIVESAKKSILESDFLPKEGECVYTTGDYFAFNGEKWRKLDTATSASFVEAPLILKNYLPMGAAECHFAGGVPFGKGQLQSAENLLLADENRNIVPYQSKILSRWPDGSIKWILLDTKTAIAADKEKQFVLKYGENIENAQYESKLSVKDAPDGIIVNTGPLQFSLSKKGFCLFDNLWLDKNNDNKFDVNELISSKGDMVLVHKGEEYRSSLDRNYELTIEEQGPLKVCLKAKGWFTSLSGKKFCQYIVRITAIEGLSYVKVQHTFVYTGYPENRLHYLYRDKKMPQNETIDAIYIETPVSFGTDAGVTFAANNEIKQELFSGTIDFLQDRFNNYTVTKDNQAIAFGTQMAGWVDVSSKEGGLCIGVKNFWQQYPKGFSLDSKNQKIITKIWPKETGELDFKTTQAAKGPDSVARGSAFGVAKTHELFFYFHKGDTKESNAANLMSVLASDIIIMATPEWVAETKVLGKIHEYDKRYVPAEDFLNSLFDWGTRQVKDYDWYGMVDFGDTLSWYRKEAYDKSYEDWGWHPEGRWGWFNCEAVGTHSGALIQFLRTGAHQYFNFGANLARHIMDIDTCHYNTVANDVRLKGIIPDDYSQVGSMHRHNGNHWGDRNEEASHTNVYGILLYYYITGDARAKDVIDEIGQFFLSEKITYYGHPDIAPQRTIANVLWGDALLYEVTGEDRYIKAADKWAQLFYDGQMSNGAWLENYNPVRKKWEGKPKPAFTTQYTLPALITYHQLTGNKAIAECIIKATDYIVENEGYGAYFDASAYCYWLTGDRKYLDNIKGGLDHAIQRQRRNDNPMENGMIYQKAYYARVMEFLYALPFAFEPITYSKAKNNTNTVKLEDKDVQTNTDINVSLD